MQSSVLLQVLLPVILLTILTLLRVLQGRLRRRRCTAGNVPVTNPTWTHSSEPEGRTDAVAPSPSQLINQLVDELVHPQANSQLEQDQTKGDAP